MTVRYRWQAAYVLLIVALTGAGLVRALGHAGAWPGAATAAFCVSAALFVFHFGLPVPAIGLVSLERVPQVGTLLVFDPGTAAAVNALASLIWPFTNQRYSQGSMKVAALRGFHNAAMTGAMMLLAGATYAALDGQRPLRAVASGDVVPLVVLTLTLQVVNLLMMAVYFWLDGRDVRRLLTPLYAFSDLLFVPGGVLAALLYNAGPSSSFALYVVLLASLVASFNASLRLSQSSADALALLSKASAAGHALRGAQRVDTLGERLLEQCRTLFRFSEFHFAIFDGEQRDLDVRLHERCGERLPRYRQPTDAGVFGWVLEKRDALLLDDWNRAPSELVARADAATRANNALMVVPLGVGDQMIGVLSVQAESRGHFVPADLDVIKRLAESAAAALADARAYEVLDGYKLHLERRVAERTLELEQANAEKELLLDQLQGKSLLLERRTREDSLTGLANRREFDDGLSRELQRSARSGSELAVAMIDLDYFKHINDSFGHALGDAVLREVAVVMRQQCRIIDLIARYGGEEFALVLPGADDSTAVEVCERIRSAVEGRDWQSMHPQLRVTLSAGVARFRAGLAAHALLEEADFCLYQAKHEGRNRVRARADSATSPRSPRTIRDQNTNDP